MEERGLKLTLKAVDILIRPQFSQERIDTIEQILDHNFKLAAEALGDEQIPSVRNFEYLQNFGTRKCVELDSRWSYCSLCMETLLRICEAVSILGKQQTNNPVPILSIQQEKNISMCCQLIVALGILPNLIPNIGIPIRKRSKYYDLVAGGNSIVDEQKYSRLTVVIRVLCQISKDKELGSNLLVTHLPDILAGLLQICYAPLKRPVTESELHLLARLQEERKEFQEILDQLMTDAYPPLLVRSLLLLQGPKASHAKIIRDAPVPAPVWMVRTCARLLTVQLMKPNGLLMTVQGVMDIGEFTSDVWQRCDSLAYIIATPPSKEIEKQKEYYCIIGPQLLDIARKSCKNRSLVQYLRIVSSCYRDIASRYRSVAEDLVIRPLLDDLKSTNEDVIVSAIEMLHSIFVIGSDPLTDLLGILQPYAGHLILLYRKWFKGVLHAKILLEELLIRFFKRDESLERLNILRTLLDALEDNDSSNFLEEDEWNIEALLSLIKGIEDVEFTYSLYLSLLEDLPHLMERPSNRLGEDLTILRRSLMILRLINILSEEEQLQSYLLEHPERAVHFAGILLSKAVSRLKDSSPTAADESDVESQSLAMIFAVIAVLIDHQLSDPKSQSEQVWSLVEPLIDPLEQLATKHSIDRVRIGADELRIAIKTRGFIFDSPVKGKEPTNAYQKAWKQLEDPLIPTRGHALLTLSNLLKQRDPEALRNKEVLLQTFLDTLEHEDSYIYLMGVQSLASLADVNTEKVVNALVQQLELFNPETVRPRKLVTEIDEQTTEASTPAERPPEVRLKVGEVLLKVVQKLGPLVPKYRNVLLHTFLRGTRDSDPFVRASSLSNLGDLCALLRYSLGSDIHELLNCVSHVAHSDPAVEVRRAAILLIHLLLNGLKTDALKVLEPIIRDLYQILKGIVLKNSADPVVTFHANQALDALTEIIKESFQSVPLSGKITCTLKMP